MREQDLRNEHLTECLRTYAQTCCTNLEKRVLFKGISNTFYSLPYSKEALDIGKRQLLAPILDYDICNGAGDFCVNPRKVR